MFATLARQGGRVHLEQSDIHLALNLAKMPERQFSCGAIEETQQLITKHPTQVQERMKREVEFPCHHKVKAAIERHPAMVYKNQTDSCLPCQNGTAKNLPSLWRRKGSTDPLPELVAPPPRTPPPPGTPHALPGDSDRHDSCKIECMPSLCV